MSSCTSKDCGTETVAAEQLGSISLGEAAERMTESETTEDDQNEASAKLCSACGEKSDTLMKCRACKCVWYCDKKCQNKHWKEHKKECKRIKEELDKRGGKLDLGEELDVGPLEKLPPREECPICMHLLPLSQRLHKYLNCCGKSICSSCGFEHQLKNEESALPRTCAFCRTAVPRSDEEYLVNLRKGVERKDPKALRNLAFDYGFGDRGLPMDQAKCIELLRESADLGCPSAKAQLGNFYKFGQMGLEQNDEEALKYWEKAVKDGEVLTPYNLGCIEAENGDHVAAMRHWRLAASGGMRMSMTNLIAYFERGLLHHGDLAETLQAMYLSKAELRSEDRNKYIVHLKMIGEYEDEMDM